MEVKEGILLDKEDATPPGEIRNHGPIPHVRFLRFHASSNPLLMLILVPVAVLIMIFIAVIGIVFMIPYWILRALSGR
jgi:uncharacterized membrane protein